MAKKPSILENYSSYFRSHLATVEQTLLAAVLFCPVKNVDNISNKYFWTQLLARHCVDENESGIMALSSCGWYYIREDKNKIKLKLWFVCGIKILGSMSV